MSQNPPLPGSIVGAGDRARSKSKLLPSPCWVLVCPCSFRTTPPPAPLSTQQAPPSTADTPALCRTGETRGWHDHGPPGAPVQGLAGHQRGRHASEPCVTDCDTELGNRRIRPRTQTGRTPEKPSSGSRLTWGAPRGFGAPAGPER